MQTCFPPLARSRGSNGRPYRSRYAGAATVSMRASSSLRATSVDGRGWPKRTATSKPSATRSPAWSRITGQVGGHLARTLFDAGRRVRAVARDAKKAQAWAERGCEVALADIDDAAALAAAFTGVDGVFVLLPPTFDPSPDFREARRAIAALRDALAAARPHKVVCLSTIGAQAVQPNLLSQLAWLEQALGALDLPIAFLRAAWFVENSAWDIEPARADGVIASCLQPNDQAFPMVATADVGRVAAELLMDDWQGRRIVELEGPARVTPDQIAACLATLLGRAVVSRPLARAAWEPTFLAQGMRNPTPRMQMLDGFNDGWIEFEGAERARVKGRTSFESVLAELVSRQD